MALEEGLYWLLTNSTATLQVLSTPLVRLDQMTGVFPNQMPEHASLPAIVYSIIAATSVNSLAGVNALGAKRVQIDCYGASLQTAQIVADAVKEVLSSFRGVMSEGTRLDSTILMLEMNEFDVNPYSYRVILDYEMWAAAPIVEPYPVPEPPPDLDITLDGGRFV